MSSKYLSSEKISDIFFLNSSSSPVCSFFINFENLFRSIIFEPVLLIISIDFLFVIAGFLVFNNI